MNTAQLKVLNYTPSSEHMKLSQSAGPRSRVTVCSGRQGRYWKNEAAKGIRGGAKQTPVTHCGLPTVPHCMPSQTSGCSTTLGDIRFIYLAISVSTHLLIYSERMKTPSLLPKKENYKPNQIQNFLQCVSQLSCPRDLRGQDAPKRYSVCYSSLGGSESGNQGVI